MKTLQHLKIPGFIKKVIGVLLIIVLSFLLTDAIFPIKPKPDFSQVIYADDGTILYCFLNSHQKWRMKTELNEITPQLQKIIIYKEDRYFKYHFGVNPFAIVRAMVKNTISRKRVSGASTITMQVVRMMEPKKRNYFNKFLEMFRAIQLEIHYSKKEILQMYLNLLPYGSNIEGVKSASVLYYQQKPEALSLAQMVTLAIVPNKPVTMKIGQNNSYIVAYRNKWLRYFQKAGLFPKRQIEDALSEPIDAYRHAAPGFAPHLAFYLKNKYPGKETIKTFIRPAFQQKAEGLVLNYIRGLKSMNITNAAVVIINNRKKAVVAYVGSADFNDFDCQGQVDGTQSVRSPGSTLKPLLYALAIDKGLITPKTIIYDVPVNFSGYSPDNYDGKFHGIMTVETALCQSYNIPAVKILDEIGKDYFVKKLISAGFSKIREHKAKMGYSVILGGCGVTLMELTNLYFTFASKGIYYPVSITKEEKNNQKDTLFSPEAAFVITEILSGSKRPDLPSRFECSMHLPKVAWKTGTSYGRKDAWAVGYNNNYTVGVWVGNFPGQGVPELNGAEFAVPLLFTIFNNIDYNNNADWFIPPDNLDSRMVCSESGLPPNDFCTNLVMDYFIPGISPCQKCNHLKPVCTDPKEKISYCLSCLPEAGYKTVLYPNYPSDLTSFYDENCIPYKKIPPHNAECTRLYSGNTPVITSMTNGAEYILFRKEKQKLILKANVENGIKKIFWYIDNRFYQSSASDEKITFTPTEGENKISCMDDKGRTSHIRIKIRYL